MIQPKLELKFKQQNKKNNKNRMHLIHSKFEVKLKHQNKNP